MQKHPIERKEHLLQEQQLEIITLGRLEAEANNIIDFNFLVG